MYKWPVVPLCKAQLQDVNPSDILNEGLYRKCNTYKGGGGYDRFPAIYKRRFGDIGDLNNQFVVQVFGCPLRCPYCYVTKAGVFGNSTYVYTDKLVRDFKDSGCKVFHLMGGAPAIYLNQWNELIEQLNGEIFHSDFVLFEGEYSKDTLRDISNYKNSLYAVSIKGANEEEYLINTATKVNISQLWDNLDKIVDSGINFYFTFTGMKESSINSFKENIDKRYKASSLLEDSFDIKLVHYKALEYDN